MQNLNNVSSKYGFPNFVGVGDGAYLYLMSNQTKGGEIYKKRKGFNAFKIHQLSVTQNVHLQLGYVPISAHFYMPSHT